MTVFDSLSINILLSLFLTRNKPLPSESGAGSLGELTSRTHLPPVPRRRTAAEVGGFRSVGRRTAPYRRPPNFGSARGGNRARSRPEEEDEDRLHFLPGKKTVVSFIGELLRASAVQPRCFRVTGQSVSTTFTRGSLPSNRKAFFSVSSFPL